MLLVVGFCAFLFFYGLGSFGMVGADEPRYAQVAREMLERSDWVTPTLYGQPWLEKPILYYWRARLAFDFFGVTDTAARLPSATLATLMIVFIFAWMRRFRRGAELDAALITAASAMVIGFARAASTDMSLAAPFTIAMLCWFGWYKSRLLQWRGARAWLTGFYFFVAVGMLAKGPVAPAIAALIIVAFALVMRDMQLVWKTLWLPGILLFLAVALPWYVAVQMRNPEFLRVFIFEHNLARFGTNMFRHKQPFWYYLPVMLLAVAPWTGIVGTALVDAVRKLRDQVVRDQVVRNQARDQVSGDHARVQSASSDDDGLPVFFLLWIVLPVAFFSISQSKLPGYVLPAVPPCLLLAANWLRRRDTEQLRLPFWLIGIHSLIAAFIVAFVLLAPAQMLKVAPSTQAIMLAALLATVVFIAVALSLLLRGTALLRFATLVPVILCVGFILRTAAPVIDAVQSERPVARALAQVATGTEQVATFKARREVEYGVAFYRNQPVKVYERLEIPQGEHVVITRAGSEDELRELLPGREVTHVGGYGPQRLAFVRVSAAH
ncbi:MAG TPA: glycosyltransferase family 39 protein [Clostridia bacterium]|nr:glycosyltransferase family 39 protein [Clostridia bacterium]